MTDSERPTTLNPQRIAKGDLDYSLYTNGAIRTAYVRNRSILARLIENDLIDDYARSALATYEDWKQAHNFPVDPVRYTREFLSVSKEFSKADCYRMLMKGLSSATIMRIERSRWDTPNKRLVDEALSKPGLYVDAYERLAQAIDRARAEAKRHNGE